MKKSTSIWLFLSSFGIMFAIMSWIQDSGIDRGLLDGAYKGFAALITGLILYHFLAKKAQYFRILMNPNSYNILVICTGNSCRSQMAEGFIKKILPKANVFSAGIETHGVNTKAIEVMSEIGIDISTHTSNQLEEYREKKFSHIITV